MSDSDADAQTGIFLFSAFCHDVNILYNEQQSDTYIQYVFCDQHTDLLTSSE
jgi:hypothetical protein